MHIACYTRLGGARSLDARHLFEFGPYTRETVLKNIPIIAAALDPWGSVNVDAFEEALSCAIMMCRHFQSWDSLARLKKLWTWLHADSPDQDATAFAFSSLRAPLRQLIRDGGIEPRAHVPYGETHKQGKQGMKRQRPCRSESDEK